MLTAKVIIVNVGAISFEGLLGNDGQYYVSVSQIARLFQLVISNATTDLERLCGKAFQLVIIKCTTDLNPKAVNVVSVDAMNFIIRKLDKKGNEKAEEFADILIGASLQSFFNAAADIEFTQQDMQSWALKRGKSLTARQQLKEATRKAVPVEKFLKTMTSNTNKLNQALIGSDSATFRNFHRLKPHDPSVLETCTRNYFTEPVLDDAMFVEKGVVKLIDQGKTPDEAHEIMLGICSATPDLSWKTELWTFKAN